MTDDPQPALKNPLRVLDIWALGVGIVVCGQYFGWNSGLTSGGPVGMLLASLVVCLLFLAWVLTLAELAVAMPRAGGPLEYGRRAGGPWLGFLMGWSMLLECLFGTIATALAAAWYVAFLVNPDEPDPNVVVGAGLATVAAFFALQAWGVKEQSRALLLMTYAALVALVVYWCVAGSNFSWERAWPAADPLVGKGWKAVLDAVPYALWWLIIIEGVALTKLAENSVPVLNGIDALQRIPFVLAGLAILLVFWSQAILHAVSFIRWPLKMEHMFLYFIAAFVQVIAYTDVERITPWFFWWSVFSAVAILIYFVDLRIIREAAPRFIAQDGGEAFIAEVERRHRREMTILVPIALAFNIICYVITFLYPGLFAIPLAAAALGTLQMLISFGALYDCMRNFKTRSEALRPLV